MGKANAVVVGTLVVTAIVVIVAAEAAAGIGGVAAVILTTLGTAYWLIGPGVHSEEPKSKRASRDLSNRRPGTTYYYDDGSASDDPTEGRDASRDVDR